MRILLIYFLVLSHVLSGTAIAESVKADINVGDSFELNEEVYFEYKLYSDSPVTIWYDDYIVCPSGPQPFIQFRKNEISSDEPLIGEHRSFLVVEDTDSQKCYATIRVLSPTPKEFSKGFFIAGKPRIEYELIMNGKIFILNEEIHLKIHSAVPGIRAISKIYYPDGSLKKFGLPASFVASHEGTYKIEIAVSKEGYRTSTAKEWLGVIAERKKVPNESLCFPDDVCSGKETPQNCPQDCLQN